MFFIGWHDYNNSSINKTPKPVSSQPVLTHPNGEMITTRLAIIIRIQVNAMLPEPKPKVITDKTSPITNKTEPKIFANFSLVLNHASNSAGRIKVAL